MPSTQENDTPSEVEYYIHRVEQLDGVGVVNASSDVVYVESIGERWIDPDVFNCAKDTDLEVEAVSTAPDGYMFARFRISQQ